MSETTPSAPGTGTSEFKLASVVIVIGAVLEATAGVLHGVQDAGIAAPWIPAVLAVLGALLQVASILGYTKSRTIVKAALAAQDVPVSPPKP